MRGRRLLQAAAALIGVAAGAVSAYLALSTNWYVFGDTSSRSAVWGLSAGTALLAAGLALLRVETERVAGALLAAAGTAWFVIAWDDPYAPTGIFVAGRIFGTAWPVLVAHSLLRMFGPLTRIVRALVVVAYTCTIGAALAAMLFFDTATSGCTACPANPLLLVEAPLAGARLEHAATLAGPIWATLLVAALISRLFSSTPAKRRITAPMALCGGGILGVVAAGYGRAAATDLAGPDGTLLWSESVLLILLSLATGWPMLSLMLTRQRLARLVVQASAAPPLGGLSTALGTVLHDSTARLLYPRDGGPDHDLIDADGAAARPQATLTPLIRGATVVAYLDHFSPLLEPDNSAIAQVARLSLENERLHAQRAAQLRELRASRIRIVAAADSERRRLERDLHDGAQQRLVSLALGIRLEAMNPPSSAGPTGTSSLAVLADAEAEVAAALAELRTIARGLFPRELADEGLVAALETFAETDPTPVDLDLDLPERAPRAVESAAFFAVAHLLATSAYDPTPGRVVRVHCQGQRLELVLRGSTRTEDLSTIEDRVGAVGGTVDRLDAGTIRIELPCVS